jgi:hypothetical protein
MDNKLYGTLTAFGMSSRAVFATRGTAPPYEAEGVITRRRILRIDHDICRSKRTVHVDVVARVTPD